MHRADSPPDAFPLTAAAAHDLRVLPSNSIGYFVYPTGAPPATASAIDAHLVVLPDASLADRGCLEPGDSVRIGPFSAGQTVGWFIVWYERPPSDQRPAWCAVSTR